MKIKALCVAALCAAVIMILASCGSTTSTATGGGGGGGGGGTGASLTDVENNLLALINAERVAAGLPELVRDAGLDKILLWYVTEMATQNHLGHIDSNGRGAEERAWYYSGDPTVLCSEIVQWWGGSPSGQVHYDGYLNSPAHHSAYMEEGLFNLGPTTNCGVSVVEGTGPEGSAFEGNSGSYSAVLLCDGPLTLTIDPFSE
jgi:uncharacterized protein YkwD